MTSALAVGWRLYRGSLGTGLVVVPLQFLCPCTCCCPLEALPLQACVAAVAQCGMHTASTFGLAHTDAHSFPMMCFVTCFTTWLDLCTPQVESSARITPASRAWLAGAPLAPFTDQMELCCMEQAWVITSLMSSVQQWWFLLHPHGRVVERITLCSRRRPTKGPSMEILILTMLCFR